MDLRDELVRVALDWQARYSVAPPITSAIAEYDAARLIGMTDDEYRKSMAGRTAVARGFDFAWRTKRYQVKANRPSGMPGSTVTLVGKVRNYDWDYLVWVLYDERFVIVEAWGWTPEKYRASFEAITYVRPKHMRTGDNLLTLQRAK